MEQKNVVNLYVLPEAIGHLRDEGKAASTAAAERPKQIRVGALVGRDIAAVGEDGLEPEIPDRAMMKKLHGMMLDKANAKGKKKKKKFETGGAPAAAAPKGAGSRGGRSLA